MVVMVFTQIYPPPPKKSWDIGVLILNTSIIPDVACVHPTVVLCPPAAVKLDTSSLPLRGKKGSKSSVCQQGTGRSCDKLGVKDLSC